MIKKIIVLFMISLLFFNPIFANDELIEQLNNKINILEELVNTQKNQLTIKDSIITEKDNLIEKNKIQLQLDSLLVKSQNVQINQWKNITKQDSLFINNLKKQNELIKPKWYENKHIWFCYGVLTVLGSSYIVKNTLN